MSEDDPTGDVDVPEFGTQEQLPDLGIIEAAWHGPLPPPAILAAYNQVHASLGSDIGRNLLQESEHRRQLERQAQRDVRDNTRRGQWMAFTLALSIIVAAGVVALNGHPGVAIALVGFDVAGIVGAFIFGRLRDPSEEGDL